MKIIREDRLDSLPGIGKSLSRDIMDLGCNYVSDLRDLDAEQLYQSLQDIRGKHIDRCVLYAFRCAIYCARIDNPHPDLQKWWNWKDNETRAV
jgi:hypothetical protein